MAISGDWNIDYVNKLISHIDGDLDYDTGAGTQPPAGAVVRGGTTGAIAKVLSASGTAASGTFTMTDTEGQFEDGETLTYLDSVNFDGVTNGGLSVGDTVTGATSGRTGVVRKIDYTAGGGTLWGDFGTGSWTNDENIQVSAVTVCLANGTGSDNTGTWTGALVNEPTNGTLTQPTTSIILNYDTGTLDFPRFAKIQNASTSPTKTAFIQKVYGTTTAGSIRVVDVTGTWANNDPIYVSNKLPYDNLQGSLTFKVGDVVTGGTSGATGKILVDTGTLLTLQNQTGTFTDNEQIQVSGTYYADVNAPSGEADFNSQHALVNGPPLQEQLAADGGIYNGTSLNVVRDCNALYTYLQDTFDELGALDDTIPMTAQVKLQQYTLVNSWRIPDLSYRFLESGSIQDSALDNVWTNYQTIGSVDLITSLAYGDISPQPRMYIEQNGSVLAPWWLPGHIDVLAKVKTNTDTTIAPTSLGVNINNGTVTIFAREFGSTYDHFETTTIAGVAPIPLATSNDLNNRTGTHTIAVSSSAGFTVGEEIRNSADVTKRGLVRSLPDGTTIEYVLTGSTQFANTDNVTGQYSAASTSATGAPTAVVAGYGTDIVVSTVDYDVPGSLTSGTFVEGEVVNSSGTGSGIWMGSGSGNGWVGNATSDFAIVNTETLTGATSGAIWTASGSEAASTTVDKDVGDGNGTQPYNAVIFCNRTGASARTLGDMYEWIKYRTRSLETAGEPQYNLLGGPGAAAGRAGNIYITLNSTYALVKASPFGTFAGGTFFGARGVFVQNMAATDIRNYQIIDSNAVLRFPPNLQFLTVQGLVSGDRVAVFRRPNSTPGSGILTTEYAVESFVGGDAYNGTGDSVIRVTATIATDTPASGVVRVKETATGLFNSYNYTSFSGTDFTLQSALGADLDAGEDVYVPLIESQAAGTSVSTNIIYSADIPLLARVRKKGIIPFEVEGTFSSTGATVTAIRATDTIVD